MDSLDKEFVPYAQSLELKELGFDGPCFGYYKHTTISNRPIVNDLTIGFIKDNRIYNDVSNGKSLVGLGKGLVFAPTFSQAFRWFREQHGLRYKFEPSKQDTVDIFIWHHVGWSYFKNIKEEEAELACLEKLIEVVKLST